MNIQEFLDWLKVRTEQENGTMGANVLLLPKPVQAPYWAKVIADMRPHYYGEMPPAIFDAFPNETPQQHIYRLKIHESTTKELLWQAMSDVKRLVMSDKFAIESGAGLKPLIDSAIFGQSQKMSFEAFIFNTVYPRRVLDPNAILATIPITDPNDQSKPVGIDLRMFASGDILHFSKQVVIVFDRHKTSEAPKGVEVFRVFTLSHQIEVISTETDGKIVFSIDPTATYPHLSNDLGVTVLGGREITIFDIDLKIDITYYTSDFGCAVSQMNILERTDNQLHAITLRVIYPHMVTQGIKCEADGCSSGFVQVRNKDGELKFKYADSPNPEPLEEACGRCGGKGTISLSVLDNITITPPNNDIYNTDGTLKDVSGNIADKIIGFASPDVSSVKILMEQKEASKIGVTEALNLVKPSKFAESGVAKEKDREGKSTALQDISDSMAILALNTLTSIASLRFLNTTERKEEIEAIRIIQPEDFEIKPVEELASEFFDNLLNKPLALRWMQYNQLLLKRFKNNPEMIVLNNIAFAYTNGLHLETQTELANKVSAGFITRDEAIKALKITPVTMKLVLSGVINLDKFDMKENMEALRLKIDAEMLPFVEAINVANATQASFDTPPPDSLGASNTDGA